MNESDMLQLIKAVNELRENPRKGIYADLCIEYIELLEGIIFDTVRLTELKLAGYPDSVYNAINEIVELRTLDE